jgi:uncharacterized protein YbjT (DUF2867 family)
MAARLYTVVGATGKQGGSVVQALLEHQDRYRVRALTRDPSKPAAQQLAKKGAEVVKCDVTKESDLRAAFDGSYGVFAVTDAATSSQTGDEEQEKKTGILMAQVAKVRSS